MWHNAKAGHNLGALREFWKKTLTPLPQALALKDKPRPPLKKYRASKAGLLVPAETAKSLVEISRAQRVSMFMTVQSTLLVLLYCYTKQKDICIGTPVADRGSDDLHDMIGCLINTLVIRTEFKDDESFLKLLSRVKTSSLSAFDHQLYPFELILKDLAYNRDVSRNPVFDVGYTFDEVE
ncbi:MAG: condensation domain-containing protein, partial [Flammeovirgaceae bacterium]